MLNDNWIKDVAIVQLVELLKRSSHLTEINLSDSDIGNEATKRIFAELGKISTLETICYNFNELDEESTILEVLTQALNIPFLKVIYI